MRRIDFGHIRFIDESGNRVTRRVTKFVESEGILVEFTMAWQETGKALPTYVPMVLNRAGYFCATKQDGNGNNLYEKFPYKVEKLDWQVEYVNED